MKIFTHSMSLWLAILLILASDLPSIANNIRWNVDSIDSTFACNDLVQISLDENCEVLLNADMIVEGYDGDPSAFDLEVLNEMGLSVNLNIDGSFAGDTLYLIATHILSGQSCWGRALIEDKWAPILTCLNYSFSCFENPNSFPLPEVWDNCDSSPNITKLSQNVDDSNKCDVVTITQTFIASDDSGNESNTCTQHISITPPTLPVFPKDTIWSCEIYNAHLNVILPTPIRSNINATGSGVPNVANGEFCPFNVVHTDFTFSTDCGETFTIIRTWTVINWCTDEIITIGSDGQDNIQLIHIEDKNPPIIIRPPFTINANIGSASNEDCGSTGLLLPPFLIDDCHDVTLRILTGIGEAIYINGDGQNGGYIPYPGLPLGTHTIIYEAKDECGNIDTLHVQVTVEDMTPPVPICDKLTNVSLGISGETKIAASVFDDGSYDNCCLDSFLVRRMFHSCNDLDTVFQDSVIFCCSDVGDTVQVVFQVRDCYGNTNDCMVLVQVEEKLQPWLGSCPGGQIIDCEFYSNFLELPLSEGKDSVLLQFGEPVFHDNCDIVYLENSVNINLDQCLQGTIARRWRVTDSGQNAIVVCTQNIQVNHYSDWVVEFPVGLDVECGEEIPETGEPIIFYENCEMIAVSYQDEVFTIVPDVCFKIVRTWTAINWCIVGSVIDNPLIESSERDVNFDFNYDNVLSAQVFHDGVNKSNFSTQVAQYGAQPDGVVVYQQIIKVSDNVAPIVDCLPTIEVCISDTSCEATFELPIPGITDCGVEISITATGVLGTGLGPFVNIPLGIYEMTYQVDDNCGNQGFCKTTITVKDCKKPTPFCKDGLIIEINEDSIVIVNAEVFNDGSFDNCDGELIFSFSIDPTDSLVVFDCSSLGYQMINVWLTDASGNQDFCANFVFVEDNNGICAGVPRIEGSVQTAENEAINNVTISLNNTLLSTTTDLEGKYKFEVQPNADYSVSPGLNTNPLNGVTTYDIVLISKHILGFELLDSPYKIIAADANFSNSVTTFDLVAIRKLILQINTAFPNGPSWRFVDSKFPFTNPFNPFASSFPEVLNFNNISDDILNANFIGIKIGDVNSSAFTN